MAKLAEKLSQLAVTLSDQRLDQIFVPVRIDIGREEREGQFPWKMTKNDQCIYYFISSLTYYCSFLFDFS
jgi:hypothetical protein